MVIALGCAVLSYAVFQAVFEVVHPPLELGLMVGLAVAAMLTSEFPLKFGQGDIFLTLDSIPLLVAAFYLHPSDAVLVAVAASIWTMRRLPFRTMSRTEAFCHAYELAAAALAMTVAAHVAHSITGGLEGDGIVVLHAAIAAAAAFEITFDLLVLAIVEYSRPGSARQFLRSAPVPAAAHVLLPTVAVIVLSPYMSRLDVWSLLISLALLTVVMTVLYFALWVANSQQLEKKRGEHLRDTFSRYVPEALVSQHLDQMEQVKLGGEQREVTVLFCDIRGFTSWSENREASEIITELNVLLTELSQAVIGTQGTLDKFTGDGLMAFWGAPFPQDDHATRACEAALDMLQRLDELNEQRASAGQTPFAIGIGVHSGHAVIGNVGHEQRLDYTAIGDTVNLSARLEAATKDIGSVLLVSRDTVDRLGEDLLARAMRIGDIQVKGRRQPVEVFALQPRRPGLEILDAPEEHPDERADTPPVDALAAPGAGSDEAAA